MANSGKEMKQSPDRRARERSMKNTELFYIIHKKYEREVNIIEDRKLEEVKRCLSDGADINAVDKNNLNNTVLHVAIENNYSKIVKYLLNSGARTDMENDTGKNAIALAQTLKFNQEILNILEINSKSSNTEHLSGSEHLSSTVKVDYISEDLDLWDNLKNNSDMMILEINSCEANPVFLQEKEFYETIKTAGNLFFVHIIASDCNTIGIDFIKSQLKYMDKQLIIQCSSVLHDQAFCIVHNGNVNVIDLNSHVEKYDEDIFTDKLSRKDGFGISLIVEAVKLNLVGTFETKPRSLLRVNFDLEKHFKDLKLIDYAMRYGDVITVRLLSLSNWNLSKLNPKRACTLSIAAEYGNMEKLAAMLRVKFPIQLNNNISLPKETGAHFDKFKKQMLETAVRAGNCDVISFIRRCGVELDKEIVEYAWDNKRCEIVHILLKADCVFPCGFYLDEKDVSLCELRTFVKERDELHELIKRGNLNDVIKFVKSKARSKLYLNKNNESALHAAFKHSKLTIFVWLKSKLKIEFRDEHEKKSACVLDSATDALLPHFVPIETAHILHLVAKSRSPQHHAGFKEHIENIYKELDNIPEISTVFKVILFCDEVEIIYDFDKDNLESCQGFCDYKTSRIYIRAKVDPNNERELLGIVAHELTHLAMQTVNGNDGKPYEYDNPFKEHFDLIVKEMTECVDESFRGVFMCGGQDKWPSELIVRVNRMLATHGSEKGLQLLVVHAQSLLKYYQDYVMPCCERFVREAQLIIPRNIIEVLNEYAGITCRIDESKIRLKDCIDLPQNDLSCGNMVNIYGVISTTPFLSTISVYQSLKEISKQPNSFIIFNFDGYVKRRSDINRAFCSDVCKVLVLLCESTDKISLCESLEELAKILWVKQDKMIIFIIENGEPLECKVPQLTNISLMLYEDVEYTLDDVTEESAKLLLDQSVSLQCRDANIKLSSLIDEEHYILVDAQTLLKLINKQPIVIGKQIITSSDYEEHFHVDRMFSHHAVIKQEVLKDDDEFTMYAISAIDEAMLANIVESKDSIVTYECLGNRDVKYIILDSIKGAQHYEKLCQQFPQHTIHWLKKVDWGLYWLDSRCVKCGLSRLQRFVMAQPFIQYTGDELSDQADNHRVVVVLNRDETDALTSIAQRLKIKNPQLWVIRVSLSDYTTLLNEEHEIFEIDQPSRALTFFVDRLLGSRVESRLETEFERNLLLHFLQHNEDRVVIMFDGFDEIKERHQNVIKDVLVALKSSKVKQLWVTTRPHMRETLENTLHQLAYTLQPFSKTDQVDFLTRFWRQTVVESLVSPGFSLASVTGKLQLFSEAVIEMLSKSISDTEKDSTGVALRLRMAAETFELDVKEFCSSNQTQLRLSDRYRMFFNIKFIVFQSQKNKLDSSKQKVEAKNSIRKEYFLNNHRVASLFTHFDEMECESLLTEKELNSGLSFISEIASNKWNTGIIDFVCEDKPHFVHSTFAEYFTAEFIVNWLAKGQHNIDQIELIVTKVLLENKFKTVRTFINNHLSKKNVSEAISNMNGSVMGSVLSEMFQGSNENNRFPDGRDTLLHVAAQEGNTKIASIMLDSLANRDIRAKLISFVNCLQKQALHLAAENSHLEVSKMLINCEADVNAVDCNGQTPLHLAALNNEVQIAQMLVSSGANINVVDYFQQTPLHLAFEQDSNLLVEALLKVKDIDVNVVNKYNQTPLHLAALTNKLQTFEMLVSSGANVNAVDYIQQTPLHVAAKWGSKPMVEALLKVKDIDVNVVNKYNQTALHLAAFKNNLHIVEILVSSGANVYGIDHFQQSPLHLAVEWGSKLMVEALLKVKDIDVNVVDKDKQTPLHLAAFKNELQIVEMLVNKRANVNAVNCDGQTPLHCAAEWGSECVVEFLLTLKNIDVNAVDEYNETPLHLAALNNKLRIVEMLVSKGANVSVVNSDGQTPLNVATQWGSEMTVKYLSKVKDVNVNVADDKFPRKPF